MESDLRAPVSFEATHETKEILKETQTVSDEEKKKPTVGLESPYKKIIIIHVSFNYLLLKTFLIRIIIIFYALLETKIKRSKWKPGNYFTTFKTTGNYNNLQIMIHININKDNGCLCKSFMN